MGVIVAVTTIIAITFGFYQVLQYMKQGRELEFIKKKEQEKEKKSEENNTGTNVPKP